MNDFNQDTHAIRAGFKEFRIMTVRVREDEELPATTPEDVAEAWRKGPEKADWYDETKECIVVFMMNTKLKCIGYQLIGLGSINECTARISEILRPCIVANCHSFAIAHNHPSGDPLPSQADIELTRRLNEAARIMGVRLQDHLVIGKPRHASDRGFFSFRESGLL